MPISLVAQGNWNRRSPKPDHSIKIQASISNCLLEFFTGIKTLPVQFHFSLICLSNNGTRKLMLKQLQQNNEMQDKLLEHFFRCQTVP